MFCNNNYFLTDRIGGAYKVFRVRVDEMMQVTLLIHLKLVAIQAPDFMFVDLCEISFMEFSQLRTVILSDVFIYVAVTPKSFLLTKALHFLVIVLLTYFFNFCRALFGALQAIIRFGHPVFERGISFLALLVISHFNIN